jgi:hypothetical protein
LLLLLRTAGLRFGLIFSLDVDSSEDMSLLLKRQLDSKTSSRQFDVYLARGRGVVLLLLPLFLLRRARCRSGLFFSFCRPIIASV